MCPALSAMLLGSRVEHHLQLINAGLLGDSLGATYYSVDQVLS